MTDTFKFKTNGRAETVNEFNGRMSRDVLTENNPVAQSKIIQHWCDVTVARTLKNK